MRAYRIALRSYGATARDVFSGLSGYRADGRWHTHGHYLDYAAQSRSLATLERLANYKRYDALEAHVICTLDFPDRHLKSIQAPPAGWDGPDLLAEAQALGDDWCAQSQSPVLMVPSKVTPGEYNLMVNSRHPAWDWRWVVAGPEPYDFEARLKDLLGKATRSRS